MALFVSNWVGGHTNAELNLFESLLVAQHDARNDFRFGRVETILRRLQVLKMLHHEIDELIVIQMPGSSDYDVAGSETVRISIEHGLALEFLYRFFRSQDRLAERMIFPEILRENFMDEIIRVVFVHLDLFENYPTF